MSQAQRVALLRKELGLTLAQFAQRLGVTATAISRIENDRRPLTQQMAKAICGAFGVRYTWLWEGLGDMFQKPDMSHLAAIDNLLMSDNETAKRLIALIARLTPEQWTVVGQLLEMLEKKD